MFTAIGIVVQLAIWLFLGVLVVGGIVIAVDKIRGVPAEPKSPPPASRADDP